jgi:hypothetical protein
MRIADSRSAPTAISTNDIIFKVLFSSSVTLGGPLGGSMQAFGQLLGTALNFGAKLRIAIQAHATIWEPSKVVNTKKF